MSVDAVRIILLFIYVYIPIHVHIHTLTITYIQTDIFNILYSICSFFIRFHGSKLTRKESNKELRVLAYADVVTRRDIGLFRRSG